MKKVIAISLIFLGSCTANGLLDDLAGDTAADTTPFFPADRAYMFVTSLTTQGNMSGLAVGGCSGGGLTQADCACTALARGRNLLRRRNSRFVAWLSTATESARCRVLTTGGTGCSATGGEAWYLTNNQLVLDNLSQWLGTMTLPYATGPNVDETGFQNPGSQSPFTGTNTSGDNNTGFDCSSWGFYRREWRCWLDLRE